MIKVLRRYHTFSTKPSILPHVLILASPLPNLKSPLMFSKPPGKHA